MHSGNIWHYRLIRGCTLLLPYLPVVGLLGAGGLLLWGGWRRAQAIGRQPQTLLLALVSSLMLVSVVNSDYRQEGLLQLINYLPFFGYYLVLVAGLRVWPHSLRWLCQFVIDLVAAALPINLLALVEFLIKVGRKIYPALATHLQIWGWPALAEPNRSVAIFNHPNFLASYMVVIFGLGLGLTLGCRQMQAAMPSRLYFGWARLNRCWVYLGTICCFLGIFCAGSRNALAVAIGQLLVAIWLWRAPRWLSWLVWGGLGALAVLIIGFGVGGRRVTLEVFSQDPRFGLWQIATQLISEHPWWGWGLGSFKLLYPARLIDPGYPSIAHPHNFWLMLASEAGLPAMLLLTGMIGYITYRAVQLWRKLDRRTLNRQDLNPNPLSTPSLLRPLLLTLLLAWGGNTAYALFDTTLFDARINLLNWTILAGLQGCIAASSPEPSSGSGVQN